ncbi:hypothetical protein [Nocardia sp. NPDC005825]|uniref:hypothetical protein n=2 Tax=unclassified Nocardia TaxID=2637762 RepID=UPI0033ED96F2
MKFRSITTTAALAAAALATTSMTANVAVAQPESPTSTPGIQYRANLVDHSVVVTTTAGSLAARDGRFEVLDRSGAAVAVLPLSYQREGLVWPIAARIDGNTATLTPGTDPAAAVPVPAGTPTLTSIDATANPNYNQALANFSSAATIGAAVGTLIGTAIGAAVGCVAGGALLGAGAGIPTLGTLAIPGAIGGCLVTAAATAPLGAAVGLIAVGGPITAVALFQFFADLATPPAAVN